MLEICRMVFSGMLRRLKLPCASVLVPDGMPFNRTDAPGGNSPLRERTVPLIIASGKGAGSAVMDKSAFVDGSLLRERKMFFPRIRKAIFWSLKIRYRN